MKLLRYTFAFCLLLANHEFLVCQETAYIIERGDIISVEVMEHPEFNRPGIVVLPDGYIQYPAIGSIKVVGLSSKQLSDSIESVLKDDYVVNPIVTVYVIKMKNHSINVFGSVNSPGRHQIFEPTELLVALGIAGGIRDVKHITKVIIVREDGQVETVNMKKFLRKSEIIELALIYPNDTVFVKSREINWGRLSFFTTAMYIGIRIVEILI